MPGNTLSPCDDHETMLGTLFSEVPLEIGLRNPAGYDLPGGLNPEVVTVVGDYAGKVYEVQYPSKESARRPAFAGLAAGRPCLWRFQRAGWR